MATKKDYETLDYYMKRETQPTYRTGGTTQKSSDSAAREEKDAGKGTTARETLDFYMNRNTKPQYRNSVQELGESEDSGIRDWFDRYDKVIRGVTDYAVKRNGGYTTDASGGFSEDIASLIDEYEGIKGYAPGYGVYNLAKYLNTLKNLQKTISETDQIMAYFGSEEAYNKFVSEQESYERKRTADLPELEKEIAQLEQQREDTKDSASMYQSIYDAPVSRLKRKFGSEDGWEDIRQQGTKVLDAEISQKKQFLNQAKLIQEQERLSSVADDPAFAQFSGYKDTEHYDPVYEYINDQNGARTKIKAEYIHANTGNGVSTDGITPYEEKGYDLMTEDEIAIYNYHYAMGGREEAQNYLNSIQESLNSRQAFRGFEDIEDNTALELIFGVSAGLDQFKSGMYGAVQAVTGEADYMPVSAFQMTSGMVREDLADKGPKILGNSLGQVAYDTITTSANMLPSILASSYVGAMNPAAGKVVGTALLGASAGGNAYQEMLNLGYDKNQAKAYAGMVAASETGLEYLLGGISKLGGKITGKGIETILNHVDNAMARVAIQLVGSGMSEFSEEYLQDVLEPWFQNLALKTDNDISLFSTDALYSGLLGFVTAGVFEGTGIISGEANTYALGRDLQKSGITAERLAELGKTYSADTVAYRLAGKVDANTGAYTIGRLFNEIGATLTEQNKADIASSLESKGMDADIAQKHAEIMEYIVEGGTLSDTQMKMIEKNDILANTLREVIIDQNSTVNQRISGYNEMAKQMETGNVSENASRTKQTLPGQENVEKESSLHAEKTKAAESGYTVSEDGKTTRVSTGEEVQIQKIDSIKDGKITFRLKDGSTADASDIQYASEDEALIYEAVAGLDINAMAANILVDAFYTSKDVPANYYALGIQEAFRYGLWNAPKQDMNNGPFSSILTEHQRNVAYENGRIVARQRAEQAQAAKAKQGSKKEAGKVHYEGNRSSLNERQRTSLSALETIADALGIQIFVFESAVNAEGKHIGENGWYDPKDGSIHIDLFAGTSGQDTMLFTAAHELTHFIRDNSPAKFQTLADFLMEEYGKKGVSVRYLVDEQTRKAKKNGRTIDYDTAYEEVVADSMETMLSDGKVVEKLRQKDKSLWEMVKGYIHDLAEKIRKVYAGLKPDSTEGKLVAEMKDSIEKIQELFTEGLLDAGGNYQRATEKENTTKDGSVRYQARRLTDDDIPEYLSAGSRRNKNKISAWNARGKIILTSEQEITDFIDKAIDKQLDNNLTVAYGKVNDRLAQEVLSASKGKIRIKDNFLELIPDNLQHAYEQHSKAKQEGDIDLERSDFEKIPEYLDSFSEVVYAIEYSSGKVGVCVSKKLPNGRILLIEAVSKSRGALQFKNAIGVSEEKYQTDYVNVYKKRAGMNTRGSESSNNSLRDDSNSNDSIRHDEEIVNKKLSDRDPSVARMNQALEKENAKLKEDVTELKKLLKLQKSLTHGTMFTKSSVESMAKALMENAGAKGSKAELAGLLNEVYTYIAKNEELTWEGVVEKAQPAVDWLQEHMETGQQVDAYGAEVLRELRGSRIYLDENQKKEAAYQLGSFNAYRKQLFGTVNITDKNAVSLDTKWAELAEMYPDVFDANITSTDMPGALLDAVGSLRDMGMVENWYDQSAAAQDLLAQVYDGYWRVSTLNTVADVKQKQIDRLKGEHIARMEKMKTTHKEQIEKLKQEHRAELKQVRQEYRANAEAKQQEVVQKYREAKQDSFLASQDAKIMEREFLRLVSAYEKQSKQNDRDVADLENALRKEARSHSSESKTWEREFDRLLKEYEASARNVEKLQEKVEAQRKSAKEKVESRKRTAMRSRVQNVVKELNDYLLKGTKDKHVPIELQKAVAEALDAVNMDTVGAEERIAKLKEDLLKAKTPEKIQEISRKIDHVQSMGDSMKNKLQALKDGYEEIIHSDDPMVANAYDPGIAAQMMTLMVEVGDTPLRDMSLRQLEAVHDVYTMVLTTVRNANKTFKAARNATVRELGQKVMDEVKDVGGKRQYSTAGMDAIRQFGWNNLKPVYAFEMIGSGTFSEIFKNARAGEDVWAVDVNEARDFYLETAKKFGYNTWDNGKQYEFTSTSGMNFRLNLEQIMSLYAYSKREQAADHLRKGGIVIDESTEVTMKTKLGVKVKFNPTEATAYNISDENLAEIIGKLTPEQKTYVDEMQTYLSSTMGEKGNEVSLQMYGVKLFKEKNYFPLKSASQYMAKAKEQQQGEVKIKNSGFSKETVKHASNPVVLTPFMKVWADHVNDMSMYHAFVLPMEDFYRVYNYKTPTSDLSATESVEMSIQNAYGKGATKYIDQLLKDLNGGARVDSTTGVINKSMNLFKKGAVFASASVVIQQLSAIARALSMIDMKYFAGPKVDKKGHKVLWEELKHYAPVAAIKEMGYFDTNMGKSTQDYILGQEYEGIGEKAKALFKDSGYRDEALSRGAALADEITWCSIWEAVKRETKAKNPGMDVKSEEFLMLAGERFTDVIVKTQVYDSVLSRSANMRSKDTGMKMATAFMAEPTTSINMVADALLKGKRGGVEGRRYCRRAIGSVVAAQILNSILVSFVYAARDDDEDETYLEKYTGSFVAEVIDGLNPATYIPFIKDIVSIVQGYDVERSDMAVVSDLWNAWKQLDSDKLTGWRKVENFAGSICQIFGLPLKNIMRDVRAMYQAIDTFTRGQETTMAGLKYALKGAVTGEDVSDREQLYQAYLAGDAEHLARVQSRYDGEDSYNAAMRTAIREHFIAEDIDEAVAAKYLVKYGAQDGSEAHWTVEEWKYAKENGTSDGYGKYDKFYTAVRTGENLKAVIQEYTDNGVSEYTLSKQITSYFKPMYVRLSTVERSNIKGYLLNALEFCGVERDAAMERIGDWDFEAQYGFAYDDRKQAYMDGQVSAADLRKILVKEGGYTAEDAAAQVEVYDWVKLGYDATVSNVKKYNTYCKPAGVPKDAYLQIVDFSNNTENDVDEDGNTIHYSAVKKIMERIDQLPITDNQKTAIALSLWKESTVEKYKLW